MPRAPLLAVVTALALTTMALLGACAVDAAVLAGLPPTRDPASVVNPLLGTTNDGNTFPGADAPFGMVQWSPDTPSRPAGGGYAYTDTSITGFSLTHLSGPGCPAMGDIPIMASTGAIDGSAVPFSHADESANAGLYTVTLGNGVKTELTATTRSGMAQFTFPATTRANLLFKLDAGATTTSDVTFRVLRDTEVSGSVTSGGFCGMPSRYTVYFNAVFDQPFVANGTFSGGHWLTFNTTANQVVQAKVGLSYVSVANAAANRNVENPTWNFSTTQQATHKAWNKLLGRIDVAGGTPAQRTVFYTALYHALLHPNVVSDTNGQYLGFDNVVHTVSRGQSAQYGNYSGWDIYRAQAQLEALVAPQQASDSAQSMVNDYAHSGRLPKWSLNNVETHVMVGDPAAAIIADYHAFGARAFDTAAAKAALVHEATATNTIRPGLNYLATSRYLPADGRYGCCNFYGSVSTLLEYNIADFSVSAFAGALGDATTRDQFANRAQHWRNMLNPATGFVQPKMVDGSWRAGFDATSSTDLVEGTSWQYSGMVPFNVRGLTDAKGGNAAMRNYLNSVLSSFDGSGGSHADLGNEPSLALPWLFDYVGQPWRTQEVVRAAQNQLWTDSPTGWGAGNDDLGTMSAWYVWSALGMFPQTPGTADLALGSPVFTRITIKLGGGATITVNAPAAADNAPYVQGLLLNGRPWDNAYLPPSFALNGGRLDYTLGTTANTGWASAASAAPPSYPGTGGAHPPLPSDAGPIRSGIAGKCVDVAGTGSANGTPNGSLVQLNTCNATEAQQWTAGGDGSLQSMGKCLDVAAGGAANGTKVRLWDCNATGSQRWTYDATSQALTNPQSGRCLDDPMSSTADRTQLQIYDCNSTSAQRWTLPG